MIGENVKMLMDEGIEFLRFSIDVFETENQKLKNFHCKEYINENSPLIANELINKMLDNTSIKEYTENILNTFDNIKEYMYEKFETFKNSKNVRIEEIKDVFNEYCNMLENNVKEPSIYEIFTGWCEDGDVFYNRMEENKANKVRAEISEILMNHFEDKLNDFTIELDHNISEIEIEEQEEEEDTL